MDRLSLAGAPRDFSAFYAAEILSEEFGECPDLEFLKAYSKSLCEKIDFSMAQPRKTLVDNAVLLLSQDDFEIRTLKKLLGFCGVEVRYAKTKASFCSVNQEAFPIVLISENFRDVSLRDMIDNFRTEKNAEPFLVLVGMHVEKEYKKFGFDRYLKHPFDTIDLKRLLENAEGRGTKNVASKEM